MLLMLRVMLVMLVPGLALAQDYRPAETPPADFSARQYIDSKGCVFLLDEATRGWKARVSRDGSPICGYPPTLSARGLDGKPRLRVLDPDAGRTRAEMLEQALSETVLTNLQAGELASDPTPLEKLPDMGPEPDISSAPTDELRAALAAVPDMRRSMGAALQPNKRLCELLGYDGGAGVGSIGLDPSQGYCDSLPAADLSRLTFIRPLGSIQAPETTEGAFAEVPPVIDAPGAEPAPEPVAAPQSAAKPEPAAEVKAPQPPKPDTAQPAGKPLPKPAPKTPVAGVAEKKSEKAPAAKMPATQAQATKTPVAKAAAAKTPAAKTPAAKKPAAPAAVRPQPQAAPQSGGGMIPAGARYVQVGTYANAANADRAAQALAGMGYPVLRGKDKVGTRDVQFIMTGPFNDRQSIVKALDGIRRAGFGDAYPR